MNISFNEKGNKIFPPIAFTWRNDFFYIGFYNYFIRDWWFAIYKLKDRQLKIEKY